MYRLTIEQGDPQGAAFDFSDGEVIIGRSSSAKVRLAAADVSGQHVRITVKNGEVVAENLSRFQTVIDGKAIAAPTTLKSGQRMTLGKSTVVRFETVEVSAEAEAEGPKTGEGFGDDVDVTGAGQERQTNATGKGATPRPAPRPSAPDVNTMAAAREAATGGGHSMGGGLSNGGVGESEGMTRAMQTRAAGQDEIEFLRAVERHRSRNRVLLIAGVLVVVGIGPALFLTRQKPVETSVSWPTDADGEMIEGREDAPQGGYALVYPKTDDAKVTTIPSGLMVTCTLGQNHDMPLRITLEETVDDQYAQETMEDSIARWKSQVSTEQSKWNIDTPLPVNLFLGDDNGVLFKILPYQRQDDGSWSGLASILRHGRRFIVVRAEVHSSDRARAEEILYNRFIEPTTEFVRSHWEGSPDIPKVSTADILARCHEELRRLAPATWDSVEEQLVGALRKSVVEKNADDEKDALEMLVSLRSKKALWYNEQLVQKEAALAQGDDDRVRRIAEFCKAVFSDLRDQRFYEVRKW